MTSVGETLRAERQRQNLGLEQIAHETKIASRFLDAIENNRFDLLPHPVFAKSFVRQYAHVLGLDEEQLATEVHNSITGADLPSFAVSPTEPAFKVPKVSEWNAAGARRRSSPLPSLIALVLVMVVCSGIYAWWQRTRHPAQAPAAHSAAQFVPPASSPKPAVQPPATPPPQPRQKPLAQSEASRLAPSIESSNPQANLHASLTADEPTWVRAWADGKEVMTATLEPSLTKTVDAESEIRLRTGNAGALQITLNGKPVGSAGPKGQIRIVSLTSQGVQILVPPKPAPEPDEPL